MYFVGIYSIHIQSANIQTFEMQSKFKSSIQSEYMVFPDENIINTVRKEPSLNKIEIYFAKSHVFREFSM